MKVRLLLIIFLPFVVLGQGKFVGKYRLLMQMTDTLEKPMPEYVYNRSFQINADKTFLYTEEENPNAFDKPEKETIKGSWKSNGDTITFFNKDYSTPKGYKYNYYPNQKFKGIKLVLKDAELKPIDFARCYLDSNGIATKTNYRSQQYRHKLKDTVTISDTLYTSVHFAPKGFCKGFRRCEFELGLYGIKDGTLVELVIYSKEIEIMFNARQYILTNNILHEVSTKCYMPNAWTDNFIKTK